MQSGTDWATPLLRMPMYVIHSRADETVPFEPIEEAVKTLKGRGGDVTLVLLDDVAHFRVPEFIASLEAAAPWIQGVWSR